MMQTPVHRLGGRDRHIAVSAVVALAAFSMAACGSTSKPVAGANPPPPSSSPDVSPSSPTPSIGSSAAPVTGTGQSSPSAKMTIASPADGAKVGYKQTVKGIVQGLPHEAHLWALVQPATNPSYYPAKGPIFVLPNGTWSVDCYFGASARSDLGQTYVVSIAQVGPHSSALYTTYWRNIARGAPYTGYDAVDSDVAILAAITVSKA